MFLGSSGDSQRHTQPGAIQYRLHHQPHLDTVTVQLTPPTKSLTAPVGVGASGQRQITDAGEHRWG